VDERRLAIVDSASGLKASASLVLLTPESDGLAIKNSCAENRSCVCGDVVSAVTRHIARARTQ
jgi:hypothetical protein